MQAPATLWTVGHSTLPWAVFVGMLRKAGIGTLVDVRLLAGSRRHPQFNGDAMARELLDAGIAYVPMRDLGGRRQPRQDSPPTAWRNPAFRGYAGYMQTDAYLQARRRLAMLAAGTPTAVLCAEALWRQCHRGLIADDFKADGWTVLHLQASGTPEEHPYTAAARIVDGRLDYSLPGPRQAALF